MHAIGLLGRRASCAVAVVCALAATFTPPASQAHASAPSRTHLHDADVTWDTTFVVGEMSTLQVVLRGATSLNAREPVAGEVSVSLSEPAAAVEGASSKVRRRRQRTKRARRAKASATPPASPRSWALWEGKAGADGRVQPSFRVPRVRPGRYLLRVRTSSVHGRSELVRTIQVHELETIHVRTDRPRYRPGQTIRWRATLVNSSNGRPVARRKVTVSITDPRNNRIWRGVRRTDASGMVAGQLPLAAEMTLGTYRVNVKSPATSSAQTVELRQFKMPSFFVSLDTDRDAYEAGDRMRVTLSARYPYGEAVRGKAVAKVSINGTFVGKHQGRMDGDGRFTFEVPLPATGRGTVTLTTEVHDGAGRVMSSSQTRPWGRQRVSLHLIREHGPLQAGVPQTLHAVTVDAQGRPVAARLHVTSEIAGLADTVVDSKGVAPVSLTVPKHRSYTGKHMTYRIPWMEVSGEGSSNADLDQLQRRFQGLSARTFNCVRRSFPLRRMDLALHVDRKRRATLKAHLLPFSDRREFRVPVTLAEKACIGRVLRGTAAEAAVIPGSTLRFRVAQSEGTRTAHRRIRRASVKVEAYVDNVLVATETKRFQVGRQETSVRIDRPVVDSGTPIVANAHWPHTPYPVYATLVRNGVALASTVAKRTRDGQLEATLTPSGHVFGLAAVRFSETRWTPSSPQPYTRTSAANVYLKPAELDITLDVAKRVAPGSDAPLRVTVRDASGHPLAGVGLAASVVDERVLRGVPSQPSLWQALTGPDAERANHAGLAFRHHVFKDNPTRLDTLVGRMLLATVHLPVATPSTERPAAKRFEDESQRIREAYAKSIERLTRQGGPVVARHGRTDHRMHAELFEIIGTLKGWAKRLNDPWGRPLTWAYAKQVMTHLTPSLTGVHVTQKRLDALAAKLLRNRASVRRWLRKKGALKLNDVVSRRHRYLLQDAWGLPFQVNVRADRRDLDLVSAGVDGTLNTPDDLIHRNVIHEGLSMMMAGRSAAFGMGAYGSGAGGSGLARGMAGIIDRGPPSAVWANVRKRFDETVLWSVGETTDADGHARYRVPMADSITGWWVEVEAVGPQGRFGRKTARVETFLPRSADVSVPANLSVGDRITTSVVVANHTEQREQLRVTVVPKGALGVDGPSTHTIALAPGRTGSLPVQLRAVSSGKGTLEVRVFAAAGDPVDALERRVEVSALGALERRVIASRATDGRAAIDVEVPAHAVPDSVKARTRVFRGPSDVAVDGLEDMLREPTGCFEQTSSSTYPNLLVLDLLEGVSGAKRTRKRAKELVGKGYQRLLRFESRGGGFSWFGRGRSDIVLSAYGLMEFADMSRVYPIDRGILRRTARWLKLQQARDGSFGSSRHGLRASVTAYVTWALSHSKGSRNAVQRGLKWLRRKASTFEDNAYALALWANAEARARGGRPGRPMALLGKHARSNKGPGVSFGAGRRTLFYGSGTTARIETTALVAMLGGETSQFGDPLAWLWDKRDPVYGWGSTQATVLALRAAAVQKSDTTTPRSGQVSVSVDGRKVGETSLAGDGVPTVAWTPLGGRRQQVTVALPKGTTTRTETRLQWRSSKPEKARSNGLAVHVRAGSTQVQVGQRVTLEVGILNTRNETLAMPTIVVPVPPGFRVVGGSLKAQLDRRGLSHYEDLGQQLRLYLTRLEPNGASIIRFQLEAVTPCDVLQRSAEAFAYYEPGWRGRSDTFRLRASRP